jgi:hypothetical protein
LEENTVIEQYLLLWWGENALDWEWEAWRKLQLSEKLSGIGFLETLTREEYERLNVQLTSDGWELQSTGSGWMQRISVYKKKS